MHNSEGTHFFVHTTSRLIIEDCKRLSFHESRYSYPGIEADLQKAGLQGINLWKEVQDFKWIKTERSPNFCLVFDGQEKAPEEEVKPQIFSAVAEKPDTKKHSKANENPDTAKKEVESESLSKIEPESPPKKPDSQEEPKKEACEPQKPAVSQSLPSEKNNSEPKKEQPVTVEEDTQQTQQVPEQEDNDEDEEIDEI